MSQWLALAATWAGMVITLGIALFHARSNRRKTDAETEKTKVETTVSAKEAAAFDENREIEREARWEKKLAETEKKLGDRITEHERRLATQQRYIEKHVPWDWRAVRELRLKGVEIEDPPTLVYLPDDE